MANAEEIAYFAGFFDGEETITLSRAGNMKYRRIQLSLVNTDKQILDWIISKFGGRIANKGRNKPTHKLRYQWILGGLKGLELLKILLPYLKEQEKVRRARLIVNNWEKHKKTHEYTIQNIKRLRYR